MEMGDFVWGIIIGLVILMFIVPIKINSEKTEKEAESVKIKKRSNTRRSDTFVDYLNPYTRKPIYSSLSCNIYHFEGMDDQYK